MLTMQKFRSKPAALRSSTGLTLPEFDRLLQEVTPA